MRKKLFYLSFVVLLLGSMITASAQDSNDNEDGQNAVMQQGEFAWDLLSNNGGFVLRETTRDFNSINQFGEASGPLKFWNDSQSLTDDGFTFHIEETLWSEPGVFSNNKLYTLTCKRGGLVMNAEGTGLAAGQTRTDAPEADKRFAIITYNGQYYLYSPTVKQYLLADGSFVSRLGSPITFDDSKADGEYKYMLSTQGTDGVTWYFNNNGEIVICDWSLPDDGNRWLIEPVADFDPAEALAMATAQSFTVTYEVLYEGKVVATATEEVASGSALPTVPYPLANIFVILNKIGNHPKTVTKDVTVQFTAKWNGPFEFSKSESTAKWYNMHIRSGWYVGKQESEPYYPKQNDGKITHTAEYLWAFGGDPYHVKVYNYTTGFAETLSKDGENAVMRQCEYTWDLLSNNGGFMLRETGTDYNCINQLDGGGGPLGFWNNDQSLTDDGSTFRVEEAQPIDEKIMVTGISLDKTSLTFTAANQTATLTATVLPSNATNKSVMWTSSNTSVATVDANGKVTAVANGTATITAKTNDGSNLIATCKVTVDIPEPGVFSNNKLYTLTCKRGGLVMNAEGTGLAAGQTRTDAPEVDKHFAIITYNGQYYLYSPTVKQYLLADGSFVSRLGSPITFDDSKADGEYKFMLSTQGTDGVTWYFNNNGDIVICDWSLPDDGNRWLIEPVADFDPTEALAMVFSQTYTVTYEVLYEGKVVATAAKEVASGNTLPAPPASLQNNFVTLAKIGTHPSTVTKDVTVQFTAKWNGPFEFSKNVTNAKWYNMHIRSGWYVGKQDSEPYYPKQNDGKITHTGEYLWAFGGNPYHVKVYNYTTGFAETLSKDGENAVMRQGEYTWDLLSNNGGFILRETETDYNCINQLGGGGGPLGFWNNNQSLTDDGSTFRVERAIDIVDTIITDNLASLHVDGRYLKNQKGDIVTLHGLQKCVQPWMDRMGAIWSGDDYEGAVKYNKEWIDSLLIVDWKIDYLRLQIGAEWIVNRETNNYDLDYFKQKGFFDKVYVPLIEYMNSKGIYAVLYYDGIRPAEDEKYQIGDMPQRYALEFWDYVSSHPKIKNNPGVMMELFNEPPGFLGNDGHVDDFRDVKNYFQPMIDIIRENGCQCVIWVPGIGQVHFNGFATNPMMGENIGYAFHAYPWWGISYESLNKPWWDREIVPVGNMAPLMMTETYWWNENPDVNETSEFGIGLKNDIDRMGNVSWNLLTDHSWDVVRVNEPSTDGSKTEYNDDEIALVPTWNWFKEYADSKILPVSQLKAVSVEMEDAPTSLYPGESRALKLMAKFDNGNTWNVAGDVVWSSSDEDVLSIDRGNIYVKKEGLATLRGTYTDGTGKNFETQFEVNCCQFPLTSDGVSYNDISFPLQFDEESRSFSGEGVRGWSSAKGFDFSAYHYLVVRLVKEPDFGAEIWLEDGSGEQSRTTLSWKTGEVIDLQAITGIDMTHIKKVLFWVWGGPLLVKEIFLSNDGVNPITEPYTIRTLVNADDKVMHYGDEVPELTYSVVGSDLSQNPILSTTVTTESAVGTYDIFITGNEDGVDYYPGKLHVIPAPLVASTDNLSLMEGEEIPKLAPTYNGFKNSDTEEDAFITKPTANAINVGWAINGSYPIHVNGNGKTNGNYAVDYSNMGILEVKESEEIKKYCQDLTSRVGTSQERWHARNTSNTKYAPIVNTSDGRQAQMMEVWDEIADKTGEIMYQTISGLKNGEYLVGVYANAQRNYYRQGFEIEDGACDIVYVSANDVRVYIPAYIGDIIYENCVCGIRTKVTDGKLRISMVAEKPGTNWHTIQIKKLIKLPESIVIAEDKTMIYGNEVPELTYTVDGPTLDGKPKVSTTATSTSPIGTYPIMVECGTETNERVTYQSGTLTIIKAPLTIAAVDYTKKQYDKMPEFAVTYDGFKNNETKDVLTKQPMVSCEANEDSAPGEYAIVVKGAEAENYEIQYVAGKLTVTESDSYTLTYMVDGEVYQSFSVKYRDSITPLAAPTKDGYTFSGWDGLPRSMPAKDVVVKGSFTINKYKLTYMVDGIEYKSYEINYAMAITPEAEPTKEGYTFSGWSEIPETMPANDVVVTGTFTVNSYIVRFMYRDEVLYTEEVNYGYPIPLPELYDDYGLLIKWLDVPETMPDHDIVILVDETDTVLNIHEENKDDIKIYDLQGHRLATPKKGINIIRMSDGTSRKVFIK